MTAIVGLVTADGATYLGCDGKLVQGDVGQSMAYPKIFVREVSERGLAIQVGFGLSGSPFILNDMMYGFKMPPYNGKTHEMKSVDVDRYVFGDLIQAMYDRYSDMKREFGAVIAIARHLYSVDSAFNATRSIDPYEAAGSGMEASLAALSAIRIMSKGVMKREHLEIALRATSNVLSSCNGDISEIEVASPVLKNGTRLNVEVDRYDGRHGW